MIRRIQLLTIKSWRDIEEIITPFHPPNVKKRRSETRNLQEARSIMEESGTQSKRR
jgi:hypothetical protein